MDAIDNSLLRLLSIDGLADQLTSRLNPEDYEALRSTSRDCRSSIPPRRPFLVVTDFVGNKDYESLSPGLYTDDANYLASPAFPSPLCREVIEDFSVRKVVLNFASASFRNLHDYVGDYVSSCGGLMCFYTARHGYIYSPTTNQYLPFHCHINLSPTEVRVALVYIASIRAFKVVMMEVLPGCHNWPITKNSVRFTALAVLHQDQHGGDVGTTSSASGEVLCETDLPKLFGGKGLGNLIGVNGALYAIIHFIERVPGYPGGKREAKMLSLDLEQKKDNKLTIFNLPPCCDNGDKPMCTTKVLSQVKDLLCHPHITTATSTVDLWMLHPHGDAYTWSKGYTFLYNPPTRGRIGQLVYIPHPAADDDDWAGLFLFEFGQQLFQYDLATKKAESLLKPSFQKKLHIVTSHSLCFSLKNGLRCPILPSPPVRLSKPKNKLLPVKRRKLHA